MYLPLTGFKERKKEDAWNRMKIDSGGGAASPLATKQAQEASKVQDHNLVQDRNNNGVPDFLEEDQGQGNSSRHKMSHTSDNMSTNDFVSLHNDMLDSVKEIAALRVLEKTLEAINKIMED